MQIQSDSALELSSDLTLIARLIAPHAKSTLLELGCGAAQTTRRLAERFPGTRIIATEVDRIAHAKNLLIDDLPNVEFRMGGAEAIGLPDASVDAVIMLKSLHHVPIEQMAQALREISRVLKPGGVAYFSEPVYAGEFNDIVRLFHDEKRVREAAFATLREAVASGQFLFEEEIFFKSSSRFQGFAEFEQRIIGATHTLHHLEPVQFAEVKARFETHLDSQGMAEFFPPQRVDLLRKPD